MFAHPFMSVSFISIQAFTLISLSTTMSSIFSSQSYFECLVTFLYMNGLAEVEGNDSNDTLAYDENAHKAVLCNHSLILCACLLFWMYMALPRWKKTIPIILLHVMMMLLKLLCVLIVTFSHLRSQTLQLNCSLHAFDHGEAYASIQWSLRFTFLALYLCYISLCISLFINT